MDWHLNADTIKINGKYSVQISSHAFWTVHIDYDNLSSQGYISIHSKDWHAIAKVTHVTSPSQTGKEIHAKIDYCHPSNDQSKWPKTSSLKLQIANGLHPKKHTIILSLSHPKQESFRRQLKFVSKGYDKVSFRIDAEVPAEPIFTEFTQYEKNTSPPKLKEVLDIKSVFEKVGFEIDVKPEGTVTPLISPSYASSAINGRWSNQEMHNAMVHYWKNESQIGPWGMWIFYAALHERGRSVGGVMFDDIGKKHRQGTAIFTKSDFNNKVESNLDEFEANSIRNRMQFFTSVHEIGHGFNLNHSWEKTFDEPWMKLVNNDDALSFMNYPNNPYYFFKYFDFKFDESEIFFMRHAPRDFVRPGGALRGINHGLVQSEEDLDFYLGISTSKRSRTFKFMEPVKVDIVFKNLSQSSVNINDETFSSGQDVRIYVQRDNGQIKKWRPMKQVNSYLPEKRIDPGQEITGSFFISYNTAGWIIDEPGVYRIQAIMSVGEHLIFSDILDVEVLPGTEDEMKFSDQYFTEDIARILYFQGVPSLTKATQTLTEFVELSTHNDAFTSSKAALYAEIALSVPLTRDFKHLNLDDGTRSKPRTISIKRRDISTAANVYAKWLTKDPETAFNSIQFDTNDIIDTTWDVLKNMSIDFDELGLIESRLINQKK